jgi:pimeloyl-ACP methyl ester carboxylesterase
MSVPGRLVEVDGEQIHIVERGASRRGEPPLILLHGFPSNAFAWRPVAQRLEDRFHTIAVDSVGFGWSTRTPIRGLTTQAHADRVARLLDVLDIERAHLAGHSYGGGIAQRMAISHADRIRRLVLVASVDGSRPLPLSDASLLGLFLASFAPWLGRAVVARALRGVATASGIPAAEIAHGYIDPLLIPGTRRTLRRFVRGVARSPGIDPARIAMPTLVVVPTADRIVPPAVQRSLATRVRDGSLAEVRGAGHTVQMERPDEVAGLLRAFLGGE